MDKLPYNHKIISFFQIRSTEMYGHSTDVRGDIIITVETDLLSCYICYYVGPKLCYLDKITALVG